MTTALLQTTYFGPVQWYQKLKRYDHCVIEQYDSYQKQTYRNRCVIATANGLQALTVPVDHSPLTIDHVQCKDLRISDHNQWRRVHWNALQSAYSESPFFEYYADDIRPFFEQKYEFLIDFNEAIRQIQGFSGGDTCKASAGRPRIPTAQLLAGVPASVWFSAQPLYP